jgi:hypothetical protein
MLLPSRHSGKQSQLLAGWGWAAICRCFVACRCVLPRWATAGPLIRAWASTGWRLLRAVHLVVVSRGGAVLLAWVLKAEPRARQAALPPFERATSFDGAVVGFIRVMPSQHPFIVLTLWFFRLAFLLFRPFSVEHTSPLNSHFPRHSTHWPTHF